PGSVRRHDIVEGQGIGPQGVNPGGGHSWRGIAGPAKWADAICDREAHHLLGVEIEIDLVNCADLRAVRHADDSEAPHVLAIHRESSPSCRYHAATARVVRPRWQGRLQGSLRLVISAS